MLATERVSLFGLTIVAGRRVEYGRINEKTAREAREIFIREALVNRRLGGRYPFLEHNADLVDQFQEMEERFRRRDIVVDEEVLFQFYDERLELVYDRHTLNRQLRARKRDDFLRMRAEDICRVTPDSEELYRFPATVRSGELELELSYLFSPGDEADGVTVRIPHHLLAYCNPQVFEWLVPGLLPEKLLLLLRRLPKLVRRRLVPLPDAVDRILDSLSLGEGSLYQELERVILRAFQVNVRREDWQADNLPLHLRMRFLLVDEQGAPLAHGRSFNDLLRSRQQQTDGPRTQAAAPALPAEREIGVDDLDTIEPRLVVAGADGRASGLLFAALRVDEIHNRVLLHYLASEAASRRLNRLGLQFLHGRLCTQEMSAVRKLCRAAVTSHSASWLSLGARVSAAELRNRLQAFLLDAVFATRPGELVSTARFHELHDQAVARGVVRTASAALDQVLALLAKRRAVRTAITAWATRARQSRSYDETREADYLDALAQILPDDFLETRQIADLTHTLRYLQALSLRIERAEHSPAKDAKKGERLQQPLARLRQMARFDSPSPACAASRREFAALVEEFRVSIFAPELGTAQPVSEQRLAQQWQEVENCCRSVE